jgi:DNA topoisomerase-1
VQEVDPPEAEMSTVDDETGEVIDLPEPAPKKRGAKKEVAPKPRTASLFKSMSVDTVDLETALQLLDLPRVVGADPESGDVITAQNGRYGPYLKKGTDSRTLSSEQQLFDITLEEALAVYAQPKYGARGASSALKEFDADPTSGKPIKLKDGRFGPYVTDGETNATVPRGEDAMEITFERAVELIADKRAKGPAPKRTATRRTTTRKAPAKK